MAKVYVKLKDVGGSFHDPAQGRGVVRDRVAHLHRTTRVQAALAGGALVALSDEEGKALFEKQNPPAEAVAPAAPTPPPPPPAGDPGAEEKKPEADPGAEGGEGDEGAQKAESKEAKGKGGKRGPHSPDA